MSTEPSTLMKTRYEFFPYAYLLITADNALRASQASDLARNHHYITALVFSTFAVESVLNHIGQDQIPGWVKQEHSLKWDDRFKAITDHCKLTPDFDTRPFKTVKEAVGVRNKFAHGKTWESEQFHPHDIRAESIPDWLQACLSETRITEVVNDAREVVKQLLVAAGYPEDELIKSGHGRGGPPEPKDVNPVPGPATWSIKNKNSKAPKTLKTDAG